MSIPNTPPQGSGIQTAFQTVKIIVEKANNIASQCDALLVKMQANPTAADSLRDLIKVLHAQIVNFTDYILVPNINSVANDSIPGYTGTLTTDCQVAITAMQSCVDTIINGIPKDAGGWVLLYKWNSDGSQTIRTFTPSQMGGVITALNSLRAAL